MSSPPYRYLHFHLVYRCRHAGACCTARWPIPIERPRAALVAGAVAEMRADPDPPGWLIAAPDLPGEMAGVLAVRGDGSCAFHRPRAARAPGCGIHHMRPASCEHFPYACVIDPRGVHVTLSHFCPTAAALLFDEGAARVVIGPPIFPDGRVPEGLDATDALPPADARLVTLRASDAPTGAPAAADAQRGPSPAADAQRGPSPAADAQMHPRSAAQAQLGAAPAERRRPDAPRVDGVRAPRRVPRGRGGHGQVGGADGGRPRLMSWDEVTRWEADCAHAVAADVRVPVSVELSCFTRARTAVPAPWVWPPPPDDVERIWAERVRAAWPRWSPVIGRYLAAKVHGSWAMHLGRGPVDVLRGVRMARAVLQVEAARLCAATGRPLDRELLTEAIRQADLLLMHHADPRALHGQA